MQEGSGAITAMQVVTGICLVLAFVTTGPLMLVWLMQRNGSNYECSILGITSSY